MSLGCSLTAVISKLWLMVIFNTCYPSKGKFGPVDTVKSYGGVKGIVLLILHHDTGWLVTDSCVLTCFTLEEISPRTHRTGDGLPQSCSWCLTEEEHLILAGNHTTFPWSSVTGMSNMRPFASTPAARTKDTVIWSFNGQNCSFYNLNWINVRRLFLYSK